MNFYTKFIGFGLFSYSLYNREIIKIPVYNSKILDTDHSIEVVLPITTNPIYCSRYHNEIIDSSIYNTKILDADHSIEFV